MNHPALQLPAFPAHRLRILPGLEFRLRSAPVTATDYQQTEGEIIIMGLQGLRNVVTGIRPQIFVGAALLLAIATQGQPVITQNPESITVAPGTLVAISVAAVGTAPLEYRWQLNGRELGFRGPTLRFVAGKLRQGSYRAVVRDAVGGQSVSAPADLKVKRRPAIVIQPRSTSVREGGTAVFAAKLNNSGPYTTIVWHNDNPHEGPHEIPD